MRKVRYVDVVVIFSYEEGCAKYFSKAKSVSDNNLGEFFGSGCLGISDGVFEDIGKEVFRLSTDQGTSLECDPGDLTMYFSNVVCENPAKDYKSIKIYYDSDGMRHSYIVPILEDGTEAWAEFKPNLSTKTIATIKKNKQSVDVIVTTDEEMIKRMSEYKQNTWNTKEKIELFSDSDWMCFGDWQYITNQGVFELDITVKSSLDWDLGFEHPKLYFHNLTLNFKELFNEEEDIVKIERMEILKGEAIFSSRCEIFYEDGSSEDQEFDV